jgi:hypothetical protein
MASLAKTALGILTRAKEAAKKSMFGQKSVPQGLKPDVFSIVYGPTLLKSGPDTKQSISAACLFAGENFSCLIQDVRAGIGMSKVKHAVE